MRATDSMKAAPDFGWSQALRRLWPYCRDQRGALGAALVGLVLLTLLRLLEPWPLKLVFDLVLPVGKRVANSWLPVPAGLSPEATLVIACVALLGLTVLRTRGEFLTQISFARIGNRVLTILRSDLFQHLQRLHLGFHRRTRGGDLLLRLIQDVNLLRDIAITALLPLLANVLVLVGMWLVMALMNWRLALLAAAVLPIMWWRTIRLSRRIQEVARKVRRRQGTLAATAAESIGAIQEVQALSLEGSFERIFARDNLASSGQEVEGAQLSAGLSRTVDLLLGISTAMVLGYGSVLVLRAELTAGDLLVFLTYLRRAFNPVQDFAKYTGRMSKAAAAAERIFELFDQVPEVSDRPDAVAAPRFAGSIEFRGIRFGYEVERDVLRGFNLTIPAGQRIALVAPSGAGKSTVLKLLLRLYDPAEGAVLIDGRDLREFKRTSARRWIASVQQEPLLFVSSIAENIALGASEGEATPEQVVQAATAADAHAFIERLPLGYDTVVGERGVTLSGGERQRIAVARAMVRDAPIVVLDEPTTGLDEGSRVAVLDALERLTAGRTTLIVSHDLELARRADRVAYLDQGRVVEEGTHAQLIALGGRYAALYRLQSEGVVADNPDAATAGGQDGV